MKYVILITGASSGFGQLTALALAREGHVVYASLRETNGRNAPKVQELKKYAAEQGVDLQPIELDVASQSSADTAVEQIMAEKGRLDVIIHNAGHMSFGPAESFTSEQFAKVYDTNVIGAQRVNRAALRHLRKQKQGLVIWVSSSSVRGGTPPYLAPYFAAKAALDSLAVSYAGELARWGIETAIIVPGAFTKGTNHFANAELPEDKLIADEYEAGANKGLSKEIQTGFSATVPPDADVEAVADAIVKIVNLPFGKRPFRTHIDPAQDGSEVVSVVADRIRAEFLRRIKLDDLLAPHFIPSPTCGRG
jgi:NAD(P)-dependent dehydrogenase (short-subunit alcohol dehydrogenase family)